MSLSASFQRLRFALQFALAHLAVSLLLAGLVGGIIFGLWFPFPYREIAGGINLFWLIIAVDVVSGPLLTLVLASPTKPRRELVRDIGYVALIQLAALIYGLYTLSLARPVALVFEVDRFRAVIAGDIDPQDLSKASLDKQSLSLTGPVLMGYRPAANADERFESITLGLAGTETSMRPNWWVDYPQVIPQVLKVSKPIAQLRLKHPGKNSAIDKAIAEAKLPEAELLWLPLVSRRTSDWVVLLGKTDGYPRAYLALDGF